MRTTIILTIAFTLFLSGCPSEVETPVASPIAKQAASQEADNLFKESLALYEEGDLDEADKRFSQFEQLFSDDPLIEQVLLYRGRIAFSQGRLEDAKGHFTRLLQRNGSSAHNDYATMYLGLVAFKNADYITAIELLHSQAGRFADKDDNLAMLAAMWKSCFELSRYTELVIWAQKFILAEPPIAGREAAEDAVKRAVVHLELSQLQQLATGLSKKDIVWTLVNAQVARMQIENEQFDDASATVETIKDSGTENAALVADLLELIDARNRVNMRTIGCLLPLTGKIRLVKQEVRKGVMLASGQTRVGLKHEPLTVIVKDTAASGLSPESAVEELVTSHEVSAIIGPMDAAISRKAVTKAEQLGVPMIVLSADDQLSSLGGYIFRKFASGSKEIEALLLKAQIEFDERGIPSDTARFGVLYPDNGYGRLMKKLIEQQLSTRNASLTSVSFPPETRDFSKAAAELVNMAFDVLILPMTAQQLALAAPALAAAAIWPTTPPGVDAGEVRTAIYLVPSVGYSQTLVARSGRYLQGANFVGDFISDIGSSTVSAFNRRFQNAYKTAPSAYAAYGYDAVMIVLNAIQSGVSTRSALRTWLDDAVSADGLVQPFEGFGPDGDAVALPDVLSLDGSELR